MIETTLASFREMYHHDKHLLRSYLGIKRPNRRLGKHKQPPHPNGEHSETHPPQPLTKHQTKCLTQTHHNPHTLARQATAPPA